MVGPGTGCRETGAAIAGEVTNGPSSQAGPRSIQSPCLPTAQRSIVALRAWSVEATLPPSPVEIELFRLAGDHAPDGAEGGTKHAESRRLGIVDVDARHVREAVKNDASIQRSPCICARGGYLV